MNDNLSLFSNKIHLDFRPYSIQNCSNVIVELTQLGLSFLFAYHFISISNVSKFNIAHQQKRKETKTYQEGNL